jgi:hypothetical protein
MIFNRTVKRYALAISILHFYIYVLIECDYVLKCKKKTYDFIPRNIFQF